MNRIDKNRFITERILILCEGENTEKQYFEGFKKDKRLKRELGSVVVDVFKSKDNSPLGLVNDAILRKNDAIKEKRPYNSIWVVFDKDGHSKIPEAFALAKEKKNSIHIIFSNISFEHWILLHFEKNAVAFTKSECRDKTELCKCSSIICVAGWLEQRGYFQEYGKSHEATKQYYNFLLPQIENALENAAWLRYTKKEELKEKPIYEINPFTNVDFLVSKLSQKKQKIWAIPNEIVEIDGKRIKINIIENTEINSNLVVEIHNLNPKTYLINSKNTDFVVHSQNKEEHYIFENQNAISLPTNDKAELKYSFPFKIKRLCFVNENLECIIEPFSSL